MWTALFEFIRLAEWCYLEVEMFNGKRNLINWDEVTAQICETF